MLKSVNNFLLRNVMQIKEVKLLHVLAIGALLFFIFLTRISHELTSFALPDASLIIFFAAGMLFKSGRLLALFILTLVFVDSFAIYKESYSEIGLLNLGYLLHLSIYPLAWFVASKIKAANGRSFSQGVLWVILLGFLISYGSHYYLYILPTNPTYSLMSFLQDNLWAYLPSNIGYAVILFVTCMVLNKYGYLGLKVRPH